MYIIVIPFNTRCLTYLQDAGYKGVTLCYNQADALEFDSYADAKQALEVIKAPDTVSIERIEQ